MPIISMESSNTNKYQPVNHNVNLSLNQQIFKTFKSSLMVVEEELLENYVSKLFHGANVSVVIEFLKTIDDKTAKMFKDFTERKLNFDNMGFENLQITMDNFKMNDIPLALQLQLIFWSINLYSKHLDSHYNIVIENQQRESKNYPLLIPQDIVNKSEVPKIRTDENINASANDELEANIVISNKSREETKPYQVIQPDIVNGSKEISASEKIEEMRLEPKTFYGQIARSSDLISFSHVFRPDSISYNDGSQEEFSDNEMMDNYISSEESSEQEIIEQEISEQKSSEQEIIEKEIREHENSQQLSSSSDEIQEQLSYDENGAVYLDEISFRKQIKLLLFFSKNILHFLDTRINQNEKDNFKVNNIINPKALYEYMKSYDKRDFLTNTWENQIKTIFSMYQKKYLNLATWSQWENIKSNLPKSFQNLTKENLLREDVVENLFEKENLLKILKLVLQKLTIFYSYESFIENYEFHLNLRRCFVNYSPKDYDPTCYDFNGWDHMYKDFNSQELNRILLFRENFYNKFFTNLSLDQIFSILKMKEKSNNPHRLMALFKFVYHYKLIQNIGILENKSLNENLLDHNEESFVDQQYILQFKKNKINQSKLRDALNLLTILKQKNLLHNGKFINEICCEIISYLIPVVIQDYISFFVPIINAPLTT